MHKGRKVEAVHVFLNHVHLVFRFDRLVDLEAVLTVHKATHLNVFQRSQQIVLPELLEVIDRACIDLLRVVNMSFDSELARR